MSGETVAPVAGPFSTPTRLTPTVPEGVTRCGNALHAQFGVHYHCAECGVITSMRGHVCRA